jgi:predicted RNA-binding protein with PIN domain
MCSDIDLLAVFENSLWLFEVKSVDKNKHYEKALLQLDKHQTYLKEYSNYTNYKTFIVMGQHDISDYRKKNKIVKIEEVLV